MRRKQSPRFKGVNRNFEKRLRGMDNVIDMTKEEKPAQSYWYQKLQQKQKGEQNA